MKKLLISLLISSILIGSGIGIFVLELSEYSVHEYRQEISLMPENVYTDIYNGSLDGFSSEPLTVNGSVGYYHYANGKTEVILDETVKNGFEIDFYYKGERPIVNIFAYSTSPQAEYDDDYNEYDEDTRHSTSSELDKISSVNIDTHQSSFTPKDFFDAASYMAQNKVFLADNTNYIIEKVVIRTATPERIKVNFKHY